MKRFEYIHFDDALFSNFQRMRTIQWVNELALESQSIINFH